MFISDVHSWSLRSPPQFLFMLCFFLCRIHHPAWLSKSVLHVQTVIIGLKMMVTIVMCLPIGQAGKQKMARGEGSLSTGLPTLNRYFYPALDTLNCKSEYCTLSLAYIVCVYMYVMDINKLTSNYLASTASSVLFGTSFHDS